MNVGVASATTLGLALGCWDPQFTKIHPVISFVSHHLKSISYEEPPLIQHSSFGWWFGTFFPYIGNKNPNWRSYFSEGLKPPTSHHSSWTLAICSWLTDLPIQHHWYHGITVKNPHEIYLHIALGSFVMCCSPLKKIPFGSQRWQLKILELNVALMGHSAGEFSSHVWWNPFGY